MKVAFYTLGCKVNQYETSVMAEKFKNEGYELVDFASVADIYVINTCTVTNMSDRKSRQIIQRAKKNNQESIIVAVGCLAQVASDKLKEIEQIDLILGNEEKKDIVKYVEQYVKDKNENVYVSDIMKYEKYNVEELTTVYEKTRAVVKIQDGCNNYCTYCIIPYARGKIRSKPFDDVVNEVKGIVKNGYKEIVLTGIHVCSYGKDLGNTSLIELLETLNNIDGLERIRLSSLEPNVITKEFLDRLVKLEKVCPHFHLSLQSGCDSILKLMNRKYTTKDIENIVFLIRQMYNNANISTDIIVGFPSETEEEFNITYNFLQKLKLNKMHIFQYSKREGTVAAKMDRQVDPKDKQARSKLLIEMSNKNENEILYQYIGKEVEVLTEEVENGFTKGFTKNYIHTRIIGKIDTNKIITCIVKSVEGNVLICEEI